MVRLILNRGWGGLGLFCAYYGELEVMELRNPRLKEPVAAICILFSTEILPFKAQLKRSSVTSPVILCMLFKCIQINLAKHHQKKYPRLLLGFKEAICKFSKLDFRTNKFRYVQN